jgi:hypothetical protein
MSAQHPGFKAVQKKIASEYGGNMNIAGAVLAKKTREASPKAKKKNPKLGKVMVAGAKKYPPPIVT